MSVPLSKTGVPVALLADALEESGLTAPELAERLGWIRHDGFADGSRVRRLLGLVDTPKRGGGTYRQAHTSYERAGEIVRALGLDPVDVGL